MFIAYLIEQVSSKYNVGHYLSENNFWISETIDPNFNFELLGKYYEMIEMMIALESIYGLEVFVG